MPSDLSSVRRTFISRLGGLFALGGAASAQSTTASPSSGSEAHLPTYAAAQTHKTLRQSSYARTGGNSDSWPIQAGETKEVFRSTGPGIVTHVWFTIAAKSPHHLKELVLRIYWEGSNKPSVEVPVGDFFGLNLGHYFVYQSAFLNCSSIKALNCYFAMPIERSA